MKITKELLAIAVRARNIEYTRQQGSGEAMSENLQLQCALEAIASQLAEDSIDATRYRWLRDVSRPEHGMFYLSVWAGLHQVKWDRKKVDETIDDAMTRAALGAKK